MARFERILHERNAKNTHKSTLFSWNCLQSYLKEKGNNTDISLLTSAKLDEHLTRFYIELRKQDGSQYTKGAYTIIRHGLQRKIKELRGIDIMNNAEFTRSENAFSAQCVQLKKKGLAKVDHKPPISQEDLKKMYASGVLSNHSPKSLQRKVFFEIMYYLCRRGQENIR